jgi:hypothetical protein
MELVKRYIAAVQRELPEAKRTEIGRELEANIMDQLDALAGQQGSLTDADIAALLKQMGHPRTVAQQFVPPQPLISLGYMPLYQHTLFMVLGILFLLQVVDSTSAWLSSNTMGIVGYLHSLASGYLQDVIMGFSSITLAFWLMSRAQPKQQSGCKQDWQPANLPKVGPSWQHISLQDIFTDMATYLFLLLVIWYPLWRPEPSASAQFLSNEVYSVLRWATPLIILGMVSSLWQLRQRFWNRSMLLVNIGVNLGFVAVMLYLASIDPLLQLDTAIWHGVLQPEQLARGFRYGLLFTALIPGWEVIRDVRRLRR